MPDFSLDNLKNSVSLAHSAILMLDINLIDIEDNPRTIFSENEIAEFALIIQADGEVHKNITVSQSENGRYLLADGQRRLLASRYLVSELEDSRFSRIPCKVTQFDSEEDRFIHMNTANSTSKLPHPFDLCSSALFYRDRYNNAHGWKKEFSSRCGWSYSNVVRALKFEFIEDDFKSAIIHSSLNDYQLILKLLNYYSIDKEFVLNSLSMKMSFADIKSYFDKLADKLNGKKSVVRFKPVKSDKFDKFKSFLLEKNIDIGNSLEDFINSL